MTKFDPDKMTKPSKKLRFGSVLGKIGFELIPVIAGILIALIINDYRESLREQKRIKVLLNNLAEEFKDNRKRIDSIITHRQRPLIDTMKAYLHDPQTAIIEVFRKAEGLTFPDYHAVSWEVALNSEEVNKLDFKLLSLLSDISARHDEMTSRNEIMMSYVYSSNFVISDTSFLQKSNLLSMIEDYIGGEDLLLSSYDSFTTLVDSLYSDRVLADSLHSEQALSDSLNKDREK